MKFTIECEMKDRWVPHFLGMLKEMERCGIVGHSAQVSLFTDGDGDFRPKFKWERGLTIAKPIKRSGNNVLFDAG